MLLLVDSPSVAEEDVYSMPSGRLLPLQREEPRLSQPFLAL